jgi:hypothetical protein
MYSVAVNIHRLADKNLTPTETDGGHEISNETFWSTGSHICTLHEYRSHANTAPPPPEDPK